MSKSNGVLNAIGKIITYVLIVLLVLGIAGMVAYFALRAQGVTYYVEYSGERYVANGNGGSIKLLNGTTSNFSVKSLTGGEVNYSVKVMSNSVNNFYFSFDGELHTLYNDNPELDNYSESFGLKKNADGFSLTLPDGYTVEQAIEAKYGGDVVLQDEVSENNSCFMIVVSTDKSAVNLWFSFSDLTVTFDPPQIVF